MRVSHGGAGPDTHPPLLSQVHWKRWQLSPLGTAPAPTTFKLLIQVLVGRQGWEQRRAAQRPAPLGSPAGEGSDVQARRS